MIALKLENIEIKYNNKIVIENFSLVVNEGEKISLMGESGSGKTSLINAILGLKEISKGNVERHEKNFSVFFQEDRLSENFSVSSNIKIASDLSDINFLLENLGIADIKNKKVSSLSGGQKRRVAIARALAHKFDILILDEPFTGLDENTKISTLNFIKETTANKTVILITHDISDAEKFNSRIINLQKKEIS